MKISPFFGILGTLIVGTWCTALTIDGIHGCDTTVEIVVTITTGIMLGVPYTLWCGVVAYGIAMDILGEDM